VKQRANMGSFELDLKMNHLRWSKNNYRIMGYEPYEVKPTYELFISKIHPDDIERVVATKFQMEKEKKPLHYEFRVLIDGKTKWLQNDVIPLFENGEMIALKGVDIDITKRKKIEERIQQINETLLNLTPDYKTNVNLLTKLFGELVGACCALYNRLDESLLCSFGQWNTPPDYNPQDKPEGHICHDVILKSKSEVLLVRDLQNSSYYETDPNVAQYHLQTYYGKAVKCNDKYVGSLCAVFVDDFVPTEADKQILGIITAAISSEEERKRAEDALKTSEKKFKGLYENAIVGIYRTTPEGDIIMANPYLVKMLGFDSFEELAKRNLNQEGFSDSTLRNHFKKQVEKTGIAEQWESIWYRKNGSPIHILESARVTYDKNGVVQYYDGAVVDITNQKQAEENLAKRLEIEQIVSKLSTDLINIKLAELDREIEKALEKVGTFSEVDRVYIFQFNEDLLLMDNTHEWCTSDISCQKENLQQLPVSSFPWWMQKLKNHDTIHFPLVSNLPDGARLEKEILESQQIQSVVVIPLVSNERLYGFMGFDSVKKQKTWDEEDILLLHLVSEILINTILRVKGSMALQESEERYDAFINTHKDLIFVKDENMKYLVVNDELAKFFGRPKHEILHHADCDFVDESFANYCSLSDKNALEKGEVLTIEEKINDKIYEVTKFPLTLNNGKVGIGGIIHDITNRKEADAKIRQSLHEKEILLQEVYHRTKNNMQVIRSLMKIHAAYLQNDAVTEFSKEIGQKIQAMALIHQKSYNTKNLSEIDLGNYTKELTRMMISNVPHIANKAHLIFHTEQVITHIESAMPFGLVMNELISFSLKESAANIPPDSTISVTLKRLASGEIQVQYSDTGKIIPDDFDFRNQASLGIKNAILLVEMQLKGEIKFEVKAGFSCFITFHDNLYHYQK
jgi:PAS domain S-box-containing protein